MSPPLHSLATARAPLERYQRADALSPAGRTSATSPLIREQHALYRVALANSESCPPRWHRRCALLSIAGLGDRCASTAPHGARGAACTCGAPNRKRRSERSTTARATAWRQNLSTALRTDSWTGPGTLAPVLRDRGRRVLSDRRRRGNPAAHEMALHLGAHVGADFALHVLGEQREDVGQFGRRLAEAQQRRDVIANENARACRRLFTASTLSRDLGHLRAVSPSMSRKAPALGYIAPARDGAPSAASIWRPQLLVGTRPCRMAEPRAGHRRVERGLVLRGNLLRRRFLMQKLRANRIEGPIDEPPGSRDVRATASMVSEDVLRVFGVATHLHAKR